MRNVVHQEQVHHYLALPNRSEAFYSSLGANSRGKIKRKQRRLYEAFPGAVSVDTYSNESEIDEAVPLLESVASNSYLRAVGFGFRDTPENRFQLRLAAERGWLRIYLLLLGGSPAAFWICELDRGVLRSCHLGYNPEFGKYSPGMFLITSVIEKLCSGTGERARAVDFGLGDAEYKAVLANSNWKDGDAFVFAPSFRGLWLKLIVTGVSATENLAKAFLSRAGVISKVRKSWREMARKSSTVSLPNARSGQGGQSGERGGQ
jgi:CelD/BcsL family acetyltransferase involved in cellulose biosynthesis